MNMDEVGDAIPDQAGLEEAKSSSSGLVTDCHCTELAARLAEHWKKLAPKLGLSDEKVRVDCQRPDRHSSGRHRPDRPPTFCVLTP